MPGAKRSALAAEVPFDVPRKATAAVSPPEALETPELVREAVGGRDHVEDLLSYLWGRVGTLYGVTR